MIVELTLAFGLHSGQEHRGGDRWFAADKAKHFFLAAFVQSASYSALRTLQVRDRPSLAGASVVALAASVGKEVADRRRGERMSGKDLTWDVGGMAAASALLHRTKP